MIEIEKLTWDSKFFGFNVGVLNVIPAQKSSIVNLHTFRQVYFFIQPDDIQSQKNANLFGAKLMDTKVVYGYIFHPNDSSVSITHEVIEYKDKRVTPSLYQLALLSGEFSRFKRDTNLPEGSFEKLYRIWIERSVNGEIAQKVFVIKQDNNIVAFATLDIIDNIAKIGLFAVDKLLQGKSLGRMLINQIKYVCKLAKIELLEVPTQIDNVGACKFYEANGFILKSKLLIYHYWNESTLLK